MILPAWREQALPAAGTTLLLLAVASAHGGYFPREWGWTLLAVALVALTAVLVRDRIALGRLEVAALTLWAALAGWTALSVAWSVSAAQPVLALERVALYATALAAMLLVSRTAYGAVPLVLGVVAGAACVSGYALLTRLVPGWLASYPPTDGYQLQAPIGYWNGLAVLAAMGALAAAGVAAEAAPRVLRASAAAVVPVLVLCLYFTFSRGGWVALLAGVVVSLVLARRRLHLLGVFGGLAVPTAAVVWFASRSTALTRAGSTLQHARSEGRVVLLVLVVCSCVGAAAGGFLPAKRARAVGTVVAGVALLAFAAALVRVGGPVGVWDRVSASYSRSLPQGGGDLNRRLTSLSSDGRTDYWRVAWHEVRLHPVLGGGAGSYARYWARYRPTAFEAQNAHNLYLETLAELGPLGLLLLAAALGLPFAAALRRRGGAGVTAASAALAAFVVHAALDWDFQLPAVTIAALACGAALLVTARERQEREVATAVRAVAVAVLLPLAAAAIAVQVGNSALANASAALDRGDARQAQRLARRARAWQPWSFEPWQLLGEAALARGDAAEARVALQNGLARDRVEWSLWYDLAQASRGSARSHALREARRLNPHAAL